MPTERPILSPARRAQRCRTGLTACLLLVIGASALNEMARADIFQSTGPDGEERFSDRPPFSGPATLVATYGTRPGGNAAAAAATPTDASSSMLSASFDSSADGDDHSPPALSEPFKPGGPVAAGKSFTAGD